MLDPWIIEEILRREREEAERRRDQYIEAPLPLLPPPSREEAPSVPPAPDRGVTVVDI